MLYPANDYLLYIIKTETTRKYLREAEIDHLLSEINPPQPSWLSHPARKALQNLGHLLIDLGQRLDRIETHPV